MAHSNGIITKPASTSDVCSTIGEGTHKVGYLCTNVYLNIYSKDKPLRVNTLSELTPAQKKAAKYGYRIPTSVSGTTLMGYFISSSTPQAWTPQSSDAPYVYIANGWWYERPKGGSATSISQYRLGDFNGYNHNTNNRQYFCRVLQKDELETEGVSYGFETSMVDFTVDPNIGELFGNDEYVLCVAAIKIVDGSPDPNTVKFKTGPYYLSGTKDDWAVHFNDDDMEKAFGSTNGTFDLYFMATPINSAVVTDPDSPNIGHVKPYQNFDSTETIETTYFPRFTLSCIPLPVSKIRVSYSKASVVIVNPYEDLIFTIVGGNITVRAADNRVTVSLTNITIQNPLTDRDINVSTSLLGMVITARGNSTGILRESDFIPFSNSYATSVSATRNSTVNLWGTSQTRNVVVDTSTFAILPDDPDTSFSEYVATLFVRVSSGSVVRTFPLNALISQT